MPGLDQATGSNMYGGVAVAWGDEGGDKPETGFTLRDVQLQPKEVCGHIVVTDQLLRNWDAANATITRLFTGAITAAEDVAFISGNGVGRPKGALASGCLKTVARVVANDISYEDLVKMEDEFLDSPSAVWVVSKRAVKRLKLMEDNSGRLIWAEATSMTPATLMGRQVLVSYRSPALGALGDVLLADWSYYLIRDGAPVTLDASRHVHFIKNRTVVKAFKTVDGQCWADSPIAQEDGQTYSPFVALDVPA
jgi:HK97 family phage major capsid protein